MGNDVGVLEARCWRGEAVWDKVGVVELQGAWKGVEEGVGTGEITQASEGSRRLSKALEIVYVA